MPRFTLIKHADHSFDSDLTMEFTTDTLESARTHFDDFLKGSGFEIPVETVSPVSRDEWMWDDDTVWDDAFRAKFPTEADNVFQLFKKNDGVIGGAGPDRIIIKEDS